MGSPELAVIGLTCNLVGVFFLANSIIFRRRRKVVEEFFGVGVGSLEPIRDYALNKMQVVIGFLFLTMGFLLQALGLVDHLADQLLTFGICLGILAFAAGAYLVGAVYSRRSFRRYLREFFQNQPWSFAENMALTKEIGACLGVPHTPDMTVEDYVRRVREVLQVPTTAASQNLGLGLSGMRRKLRDISPLAGR